MNLSPSFNNGQLEANLVSPISPPAASLLCNFETNPRHHIFQYVNVLVCVYKSYALLKILILWYHSHSYIEI